MDRKLKAEAIAKKTEVSEEDLILKFYYSPSKGEYKKLCFGCFQSVKKPRNE